MKTLVEAERFSVWYDAREDRLRLVANPESMDARVDFWITRRLFLSFVTEAEVFLEEKVGVIPTEVIEEMLEKSVTKEKKSRSVQKSSSSTDNAMEMEKDSAPVGDEAMLLENINIKWSSGSGTITLELSSECCEVYADMGPESMMAFLKMLIKQAPSLEWGVSSLMFGR